MMWAAYIAVMAVLIIATPLVHWRRSQPRWDRHSGGSAGVLRDQIVSYAPTAAAVLVIVIALAAVELGLISVRPNGLTALSVAAIVLALGAGAGFFPPIVAARRRLLAVRIPVHSRRGRFPQRGTATHGHVPLSGDFPAQPGERA